MQYEQLNKAETRVRSRYQTVIKKHTKYMIILFFSPFRGRFALVKKLCQKCSGQEVAAKCIRKRLVTKEMVETEFNTLQSLQHDNLIQVFDLYESPSNLVIVMQL